MMPTFEQQMDFAPPSRWRAVLDWWHEVRHFGGGSHWVNAVCVKCGHRRRQPS